MGQTEQMGLMEQTEQMGQMEQDLQEVVIILQQELLHSLLTMVLDLIQQI